MKRLICEPAIPGGEFMINDLVVQRNDSRNGPQPASKTQRKKGDFDSLVICEACENRPEPQLSAMLDWWFFAGIFLTPVRFAGLDAG